MKKNKYEPPPITPETTLENARKWLSIIRYHESGSVIQLQDDCEYRVLEIINNKEILKTHLGPYYKKYLLAYIPIGQNNLQEKIHETLLTLAYTKRLGTRGTLENLTNGELLSEIGNRGYEVGMFISDISSLLTPTPPQSLMELESLIRMSKNFSVIVFSEIDITHPSYPKLADKCSFLFDHVITYPLYQEADARQFMLHYISQWKFKIPDKTASEIVRFGGGYLWIIHHLMRHLRDNPNDTLEKACENSALITKLISIWDKLDTEQKEILRKLSFGTLTEADLLSHEYTYLTSIRLIVQADKPFLGLPLLTRIIENELAVSKWTVKDNTVRIGGKNITNVFTPKEKLVLSALIHAKKTIIARDTIAKILWPLNAEENYSDWAIDRLLFRLRNKLKKVYPNKELIKTVKKKGFIFT